MSLDRDHVLGLWRDMVRVRTLEERCVELYQASKIRGFLHVYIGEEAVAAGALSVIAADEAVVATYREHGHALLKGVAATAIMAEMYGKAEGCSRGHGGSMHLFDAPTRFYGGNAIVGGGLPVAVGLALADKMQDRPRATACFFGEGAVAEGQFHECMNLAALWGLPVLFLCENNLYAMGTALERSESQTDLARKADAYGIQQMTVDGMDVLAVEEAVRSAATRSREGGGPAFIEFRTYRFRAHSMFDPELYRDKDEVERWKLRDPISIFGERLQSEGLATPDDLASIRAEAAAEVDGAVAFAEAGHDEPVADLLRSVTSER